MDIEGLNEKYRLLSPEERVKMLYKDFSSILFTSSFGATSVLLIHLFRKVNPNQEILFLNTTYHFAETLEYKSRLTKELKLNVKDVLPEDWKNKFTFEDQTWKKDPDLCCSINKVEPLEKIKGNYDVWVSGLMSWQTPHRKSLDIFDNSGDIIKFHPVIDMSEEEMKKYMDKNKLHGHPLIKAGYSSIGCFHCTVKGKGRQGRWVNKSKDECGLHL